MNDLVRAEDVTAWLATQLYGCVEEIRQLKKAIAERDAARAKAEPDQRRADLLALALRVLTEELAESGKLSSNRLLALRLTLDGAKRDLFPDGT